MADAAAEGAQAYGALSDAVRKSAAFNALSRAYGPAAGDPEADLQLQEYGQRQQTNPIAVQQAQANLTGTQQQNQITQNEQQRNAAYRATQMLISSADPQTGAVSSDAYDKIVRPHADLFGIDPGHVDQLGDILSQPGGVDHLQTMARALIGPTAVTGQPIVAQGANGQSVILQRDKNGNMIPSVLAPGVVPVAQQRANQGQQNADTNAGKLPILQQNANTNAFSAGVRANNSQFGAPNGATAPGQPAAKPDPNVSHPDALFNRLPPKGKIQATSQATQIVDQGENLGNTNRILDTIDKQISPYTAGTGSLIKGLPGTAQADLKANLSTLKAQGLMTWISSLKNAGGQTGIGRVLQSEANAAGNLYGNMEQDQSAKQLAFHAQLFRSAVNRLYQHSQEAFKSQYGLLPHEAIGAAAPNTGGLPTGWKYLGAKQ